MKNLLITTFLLALANLGFSQAIEGKIEYNKEKQNCLVIEYNYPSQAVEDAFVAKMKDHGHVGKEEKGLFNKDKGFKVYKNALIPGISNHRYDYVVNIERKSKKESEATVLYLIIMKDDANALSRLSHHEHTQARNFLHDLAPHIEDAHLELQITAQEDVVIKAEKKLKGLQNDKEDMEKKIKKLEDDIKANEKDQENLVNEIENHRKNLDAMKGKRKKSA